MGYKFKTYLRTDTTRPFIWLPALFRQRVLVDTGADMSMWIGKPELLEMLGAEKKEDGIFSFYSCGGSGSSDIYMLYNVSIGPFIYDVFPIATRQCIGDEIPHLILGASVMNNAIFAVDFNKREMILAAESRNRTVVIKTDNALLEYSSKEKHQCCIHYVYKGEDIPMNYNATIETIVESVQSRVSFINQTEGADTRIKCDDVTKALLVPYISRLLFL